MTSTATRPAPGDERPGHRPSPGRQAGPRRPSGRLDARRLAAERRRGRRRRAVVLVVLVVTVLLVGVDVVRGGTGDPAAPAAAGRGSGAHHGGGGQKPSAAASPSARPSGTPGVASYPRNGGGKYTVAPGQSAVLGQSGTLLRFQVAMETDIWNLDVGQFANQVVTILGDKRGWTTGGDFRFQRVGPGQQPDFTLYLVTPGTRDKLCHDNPDGYTSCRYNDSVVLNVSRWVHGASAAGYTDLNQYRDYAVSHEVGHRLGHEHELCPGDGQPAPTMQQQTLGLHGCTPNPWPYPNGERYAGPEGDYPQTNIPSDPPSFYRS